MSIKMQLYKLKITPKTSFCSELQSDTLFGAFCWSYKYIYGEDRLLEFIEQCMENKPPIIFSNAFPEGAVPLPLEVMNFERDFLDADTKEQGKKIYQNNKILKKTEYISIDYLNKYLVDEVSSKEESKLEIKDIIVANPFKKSSVIRNMVNRNSGTVEKEDNASNLFSQNEYYCSEGMNLEIYIQTILEKKVLSKVLELMFMLGIGGKKSTGKGRFEILSLETCVDFNKPKNVRSYLLLSNYIPAQEDSTKGYYTTFTKNPMLDREYANSATPYKKPLLFIKSGAVFSCNVEKPFLGRCVSKVSALSEKIIVSGFAIAIPLLVEV